MRLTNSTERIFENKVLVAQNKDPSVSSSQQHARNTAQKNCSSRDCFNIAIADRYVSVHCVIAHCYSATVRIAIITVVRPHVPRYL